MHVLHLKDIYLDKIIPLVDKSYGTTTGFYLFRDLDPSPIDQQFLDLSIIPVYDNYRNPSSWVINDTTKWWQNLDTFCRQASSYNITIIPTLFDFCCSPHDPFITKISNPYTTYNWDDSAQGEYIRLIVHHIKSSGAKYILNLGSGFYQSNPLLPDSGWIRKLIMFLLDTCGVPSDKLTLTNGPDVDLFSKNPYCRYKTWTGTHVPLSDEINNEEVVDGEWGGTAQSAIYDPSGKLIGGYAKYLTDDILEDAIPCMNMWKMQDFVSNVPVGMPIDHPNAINYIFAPNQREAMRIVLGDPKTNNGFIDFT